VLLVVAATRPELEGAGDAETLTCGVGPVEAAAATARALAERRPSAVLHIGLAGALRGCGVGAPQLVIGSEAVYCDLAPSATALAPRRAVPDAGLLQAARRALPDAPVRAIGTSARVGGTSAVDVEAMEGFAVLRACQLAGVPAVEVRAVSNEIEEPDRARWRFAEALGALAGAAPRLIEEVRRCAS
jgi:nucleoside phosphorylase